MALFFAWIFAASKYCSFNKIVFKKMVCLGTT